ncbi:MAG: hypothetical protein KF734_12155 [Saprospiraceae bacterium]|nr:hypothetical protein [Saprospiraceae bacterium]
MTKRLGLEIFERLKTGAAVLDADFDAIFSKKIRALSEVHFTPIKVALAAAGFLVDEPGTRVLDVGSGVGKFCMIGASCTEGHFTGVEQRERLHQLSVRLSERYHVANTHFILSNMVYVDFNTFDAIYLFNPFYENILQSNPIDNSVKLDKILYAVYSLYVRQQLDTMPVGTRVATYFSYLDEVPDSYEIQATDFDRKLKLWQKVK